MSTTTTINYPSVPQHFQPAVDDIKMSRHRRSRCTVKFSESSQLAFFDATTSTQEQYYTALEKHNMKRQLVTDARRLGALLASEAAESIPQDDIIACIGIEHLLSMEKARRAMEHRANHMRVVLEGQRRGYHAEDVAMLSQEFSRSARDRAAQLAVGYANML